MLYLFILFFFFFFFCAGQCWFQKHDVLPYTTFHITWKKSHSCGKRG